MAYDSNSLDTFLHNYPHTIIILTITFQNTILLQSSEVTFDGALAH